MAGDAADDSDDDEGRPFSPSERKEIRRLVEAQERTAWFWGSIRVWATWVSAAAVGAYAMADAIEKFLKKVFGQ